MTVLIHDNMSRGRTQRGWLDAFHSFSFGSFLDPTRMGFGRLRVLNEDRIVPGAGFAEHEHADMDILTLVLAGRIRHEDSLGNVAELFPGEIQLMRAGSGVTHSETNPSATELAHVIQIWMIPDRPGGVPAYQQVALPEAGETPVLLATGIPGAAPLSLGSDTRISIARPGEGARTQVEVVPGRKVFVQFLEGLALMETERLVAGDGVQLEETPPAIEWQTDGAILVFDMSG
jgi:quercetin 2,3-dioxygenase